MTRATDILRQSDEFEQALAAVLGPATYGASPRSLVTRTMCNISLEHGRSLRLLSAAGNLTSATSLLRLQFETITRALWLLYAASDGAVSKLHAPLTEESEKAANNLPTLTEMIGQIAKNAPPAVAMMLAQFKEATWKATNSYVHGGIHAASRHGDGYPEALVIQVLQSSNGLSAMAAMALAILSRDPRITKPMGKIQQDFRDCLPPLDLQS